MRHSTGCSVSVAVPKTKLDVTYNYLEFEWDWFNSSTCTALLMWKWTKFPMIIGVRDSWKPFTRRSLSMNWTHRLTSPTDWDQFWFRLNQMFVSNWNFVLWLNESTACIVGEFTTSTVTSGQKMSNCARGIRSLILHSPFNSLIMNEDRINRWEIKH